MKKFKKPEFKINKMDELSEPVFMSCSGSDLFDFPGDGWTHQYPEDGRWNFAEQMNGKYLGEGIHPSSGITTYAYVTFDQPVNIVQWDDSFHAFMDPEGSYTIVGAREWPHGLNKNEGIGLGALYVMTEDPNYTGPLTIVSVKMAFSYDGTMCK